MGKINLQRVVVGGLVAGLILNVVDFLLWGMWLAGDMNAAMEALGRPPVGSSAMVWFVLLDFLLGIALVWAYAAMRPRFGAGARTAVYTGIFVWVLVGLLYTVYEAQTGLFPLRLLVIGAVCGLVALPVASVAGAKLYTEA